MPKLASRSGGYYSPRTIRGHHIRRVVSGVTHRSRRRPQEYPDLLLRERAGFQAGYSCSVAFFAAVASWEQRVRQFFGQFLDADQWISFNSSEFPVPSICDNINSANSGLEFIMTNRSGTVSQFVAIAPTIKSLIASPSALFTHFPKEKYILLTAPKGSLLCDFESRAERWNFA